MRAVDLFCGAGALSLGLKGAGINVVGAVDHWNVALEVYRSNVADHAWCDDLRDIVTVAPKIAKLHPTLIAGGPPCQDFSAAGPGTEGERAELLIAFAMLSVVVRPQWLLIENVARAQKSAAWAEARHILNRAGYGLTEAVVDASWYGVAQTRKRLIVIGRLGEATSFLSREVIAARQSRRTTVRDIIGSSVGDETNPKVPTTTAGLEAASSRPTTERETHPPQGSAYFFIRPFKGGRGVRSIDEPAPAIVRTSREPPARGYLLSPSPRDPVPASSVPQLTQEQTASLQGFPRTWNWGRPKRVRDIDQMIANAVPVALAQAIGRIILARHTGSSTPAIEDGFSDWLRGQGLSGQVLRNRRYALGRARRFLEGRVIADLNEEIRTLEGATGFAALPAPSRSDLRAALRSHAEWRALADRKAAAKETTPPLR